MIAVIDACVLYPTVMRAMVLGAAKLGHFTPKWSDRLLEEWAGVARKLGPAGEVIAKGEIATANAAWPQALCATPPGLADTLWLPDASDRHVLATAITARADVILTLNLRDFPASALAEFGIRAVHPDACLRTLFDTDPIGIAHLAQSVQDDAERLGGIDWNLRKLMKKARLPRLGKALTADSD